jgi:hypothetical protein
MEYWMADGREERLQVRTWIEHRLEQLHVNREDEFEIDQEEWEELLES